MAKDLNSMSFMRDAVGADVVRLGRRRRCYAGERQPESPQGRNRVGSARSVAGWFEVHRAVTCHGRRQTQ